MNLAIKISIGLLVILLTAGVFIGGAFVSYYNQEVELKTAINAKLQDNQNEFDLMAKKISQTVKVTDKQMVALKQIFVENSEARTNKSNNQLMTWVQESSPVIDTTTFNNLQNIITSSRDRFALRQKELIDLNREHDLLLSKFPSNIILSILGAKHIDITVITSGRTEEAFFTGKDNKGFDLE
jgi:hypothetical protein